VNCTPKTIGDQGKEVGDWLAEEVGLMMYLLNIFLMVGYMNP
jgi:hypothetical protein